ncbi:MAG TPA: molybdenum cofactor guanylyltransferase [Thermomicrobiales bacterium]|nr:molybdenum cofactor guanylyltransferase [Thermomicrobiales bacterium]
MTNTKRPTTGRTGVVLAGGASRRYGSDKALSVIPGSNLTFLAAAANILRDVLDDVLIVAPADRRYNIENTHQIADQWPGEGPLGGVISVHKQVPNHQLLVIACDQVWLRSADLIPLLDGALEATLVCYAGPGTSVLPLPFFMQPECGSDLEKCFLEGERSLRRCLDTLSVMSIPMPTGARLDDVDWPDDLAGYPR